MASVHHVHAVLNKLLNDAERKGLVMRNVARLANAPSLPTARARGPEMTVWSPAELATFLAAIEGNRNEALFRLLAMTGMRRSEVVGLRWSDVNLDRHRLTVNQAATVVDGDENIDTPKTRRSRRVIDLDADTVSLLQRHRTQQRELYLRLGVTATASDRVFTNEIGDPIRPNSIGQAFAASREGGGRAAHPSPRPPPHPRVALAAGRREREGRQRTPRPRLGELHPRHLRPRHARPASAGRIGRRSAAEGVNSTLLPRIMSAII